MFEWAIIWWHHLYNHESGAGLSDCLGVRNFVWLHASSRIWRWRWTSRTNDPTQMTTYSNSIRDERKSDDIAIFRWYVEKIGLAIISVWLYIFLLGHFVVKLKIDVLYLKKSKFDNMLFCEQQTSQSAYYFLAQLESAGTRRYLGGEGFVHSPSWASTPKVTETCPLLERKIHTKS